jgi:hypothetical protein
VSALLFSEPKSAILLSVYNRGKARNTLREKRKVPALMISEPKSGTLVWERNRAVGVEDVELD